MVSVHTWRIVVWFLLRSARRGVFSAGAAGRPRRWRLRFAKETECTPRKKKTTNVQHPQQREHRGSPNRIHKHHLGRIRGEYRGVGQVVYRVHGESHQRVRQPFRSVLRAQRTTNPEQDAEQRDVRSDRVFGSKGEWCLLNRFEGGFVNQWRHVTDP